MQVGAEALDFLKHVGPEPGRRGELHPVGLLVKADPEPEIVRINVELALHGDDVRSHQQEPAGRRRFRVRGERGEGIVLAQDLARQEGKHSPELAAGDGAARGRRSRCHRRAPPGIQHLLKGRLEHHGKTLGIGLRPRRPVNYQHMGIAEIACGFQTGDVMHMRYRDVRAETQAVHGFADLGRTQYWTGGSEPGGRGGGQLPVDEGLGLLLRLHTNHQNTTV